MLSLSCPDFSMEKGVGAASHCRKPFTRSQLSKMHPSDTEDDEPSLPRGESEPDEDQVKQRKI